MEVRNQHLISDIDGEEITPKDVHDINKVACLNCGEPFVSDQPILIARPVKSKKLMWWHAHHCAARSTKDN